MLFKDELQVFKHKLDHIQREGPASHQEQIERTFLLDTVTNKGVLNNEMHGSVNIKTNHANVRDTDSNVFTLTFGKKRPRMKMRMTREAIIPVLIPAE